MRAREVRERLANKIDPELRVILEAMCEDNHTLRDAIAVCGETMDQLITEHGKVLTINENMVKVMDKIKKRYGDDWEEMND